MALTATQGNNLRAKGVFTPDNNTDPAGSGDGTQGGFLEVAGKAYSTQTAGWREAMITDMVARGYVDNAVNANSLYNYL